MLQLSVPWYRDESLLNAWSNLALIALLVVTLIRNEQLRRLLRRSTRKLLIRTRELKGVRYALNVTVNQFHALKRRVGRRHGGTNQALKPPPPAPAKPLFVVPPPLELAPLSGEDLDSWGDSGLRTALRPSQPPPAPFDGNSTQPISLAAAGELVRQTIPPQK